MAKKSAQQKTESLQPRPPVVVVLGHVDHGKSSLLEAIRKDLRITPGESGGITQHVGAYEVEHQGKTITFLDTPGHEAFSAMRSRGAKVADIAVLVVAADEGIKQQTKEAISHAKDASLQIVAAINKMDKPGADPEKVKRELIKEDIIVESMGGKVPSVEISAKTGQGINDLLDIVLLVAEIENLKGNPKKSAEGVVVEAYLDVRRGSAATFLVREGSLKIQDIVATASASGRVKILEDFQGRPIKNAGPSKPVIVVGLDSVPAVGEAFRVFEDMDKAKVYVSTKEKKRVAVSSMVAEGDKKIFNLILKADVQGSLEAIESVLGQIPQEDLVLRILERGVGDVSESDIKLAQSANALIVGFRVKVDPKIKEFSERNRIPLRIFDVIYELTQGVRQFLERRLEPEIVRIDLGKMKVLVVFFSEKNRQIVGGKIIDGEIQKGTLLEISRGEEVVGKGKILNLQKDKKDIGQAKKGDEVGILYEGQTKIVEGDALTIYKQERKGVSL